MNQYCQKNNFKFYLPFRQVNKHSEDIKQILFFTLIVRLRTIIIKMRKEIKRVIVVRT
jgi:hypothetical protein